MTPSLAFGPSACIYAVIKSELATTLPTKSAMTGSHACVCSCVCQTPFGVIAPAPLSSDTVFPVLPITYGTHVHIPVCFTIKPNGKATQKAINLSSTQQLSQGGH